MHVVQLRKELEAKQLEVPMGGPRRHTGAGVSVVGVSVVQCANAEVQRCAGVIAKRFPLRGTRSIPEAATPRTSSFSH